MSPLRCWSLARLLFLSALISTACVAQSQALQEAAAEQVYSQSLQDSGPRSRPS